MLCNVFDLINVHLHEQIITVTGFWIIENVISV